MKTTDSLGKMYGDLPPTLKYVKIRCEWMERGMDRFVINGVQENVNGQNLDAEHIGIYLKTLLTFLCA